MSGQLLQTALSVKQPWATLIIAGVKTMEIRRWPTARRERILIHAARVPDARDEGWRLITDELLPVAQLGGGIIGSVELTGCIRYTDAEIFERDQLLHRNDPSWFESAGLFGLVFTNPEKLTFRKYPGWFRFFPVDPVADPTKDPRQRKWYRFWS